MSQPPCQTDELYHIYNRGVEKRDIYGRTEDFSYFMHLLYILNDTDNANNIHRTYARHTDTQTEGGLTSFRLGEPLVDVLCFALMPNHFHLLLKQRVDGGIGAFMQRLGTGYTMYFNEVYKRSGALFQGTYKRVMVQSQAQLLWLPHYIHLNPLALRPANSDLRPEEFLLEYKWSSYPNYVGRSNYKSVIEPAYILELFGGHERYRKDIMQFIRSEKTFTNDNPRLTIDFTP